MSYQQRPTIGNQGAYTRSFQQGSPPYSMDGGGELYGNPYAMQQQFNPGMELSSVTPGSTSLVPATNSPAKGGLGSLFGGGGGGGGGGGFNAAQLKQVIDRLGGIEGIVDTVSKVQKMVQSVQQMAPLIKMVMNSFGKKGGDADAPSRRKKRRKRKPTAAATGKRRTKRPAGR